MKILVIQQKRIGDVLTSTILSNNLKQKYPNAQVDYMCYANCVDVLKNNPNIDNIIVLEEKVRKNYLSLFQFIFKIRSTLSAKKNFFVGCCPFHFIVPN